MIKRLYTLMILLAVVPSFGMTQRPNRDDPNAWWVNVPSAPIIFDYQPIKNSLLEGMYKRKYWFGLRNRSSKAVIDYSIGCVIPAGKGYKVVKRFYGSTISDGGYGRNFFWAAFDASDPDKDERYGKGLCKDSKVAVVKVGFMDNSYWSVPGAILVKPSFQ